MSKQRGVQQQVSERIVLEPELVERTGLNRATLFREEQRGALPVRRRISAGRRGWLASEIDAWLRSRPRAAR